MSNEQSMETEVDSIIREAVVKAAFDLELDKIEKELEKESE